jgi:NADH-quinone oxidoreductase subunit A
MFKYGINLDFLFVIVFFFLCGGFSVLLAGISSKIDSGLHRQEQLAAYECGFAAFDDARNFFFVKFYLVGLLFIIFDLEVMFLYPWSFYFDSIILENSFGWWVMVYFLGCLIVGFIYEWEKGALNWE